jgi:hypothetical protein
MPLTIIKADPRGREKPCLRCGYSLRKITDSNYCPECGLSVWLSLNQNDTLEMSNPDWLRRMALGLWILAAASVIALAVLTPVTIHTFQTMLFRQRFYAAMRQGRFDDQNPKRAAAAFVALRPPTGLTWSTARIIALAGAGGIVIYQTGLILLTSGEGRYPDRLLGLRVGARIVAGLAGLALVLMVVHGVRGGFLAPPEWLTRLVMIAAAMITFGQLRASAARLPDQRLSRFCGWMMLAPLVSLFYSFIRDSDWLPDFLPLAFFPVAAVVFIRFGLLLLRVAVLADRQWATETAPGHDANVERAAPGA